MDMGDFFLNFKTATNISIMGSSQNEGDQEIAANGFCEVKNPEEFSVCAKDIKINNFY